MTLKDKVFRKLIARLDRIAGWLEDRLDDESWMDFNIGGTD